MGWFLSYALVTSHLLSASGVKKMRFCFALNAVLAVGAVAHAAEQRFPSSAGDISVQTVASGLVYPWSLAFLPDGRMLVTERPGRIRIVSRNGQLSPPLGNVPRVFASGQGGLLDVILDRDFAQNRTIYFSYAEPFNGGGALRLHVPGLMTMRCHGSPT